MRKKIEKIMDGIQNFLQVVAILLILITIILSFYYNTQYHSYRLLRPQLIQGLLIGITLIGILFILRDSLKKSLNPQKQMGKNKKYLIHGIELITIVLLGVFYAHVIFEVKYKPVLDYIWVSICFSGAIFGAL